MEMVLAIFLRSVTAQFEKRRKMITITVAQQRNGMRTRRCWENSKRGCDCRQHYFFDAHDRVDHAREYGPQTQSGDGCCNYPTVSVSIHRASEMTYSVKANRSLRRAKMLR